MRLVSLTAVPLEASFAAIYGGLDSVPTSLLTPAAHFRRIHRTGQLATLVLAESDNGTLGYGEAFGLPHPYAATALIEKVIAPAVVGLNLGEPAEMLGDVRRYFAALGSTRGPAVEALAGVDIALWDLKARVAGRPLASLLGGTPGPVATYASPIALLDRPEQSAEAARAFLGQGYKAVKLKIGRGVEVDLDHIAAVRAAVGSGVPLMLDANCAYDVPTSIRLAQALVPHDIAWLEEPVPPDDPAGLAEVRRNAPVPIAAGENEFTTAAFAALVKADAVDVLQPNITRAGGVSGMLAIGKLCADAGVKLAPHGVGGSVGVAAALHVCRAAPGFHIFEANRLLNPMRDEMGLHPPQLVEGAQIARDLPGHGGEPEPGRLARYRLDTERTDLAHPGA